MEEGNERRWRFKKRVDDVGKEGTALSWLD